MKVLIALTVFAPFVTVATNPEPLVAGISYRPALGTSDAVHGVILAIIGLMPFLVGYYVLSSREAIRIFMRILLIAGLAYSIPMLIEVRLSPQINVWIYGFFAHDFSQAIRYGGFRPMVFLQHGLWVALFAMSVAVAAAVAFRTAPSGGRQKPLLILGYLMIVLVLCKSVGALAMGLLFVPLVLLLHPRQLLLFCGLIALAVLIYPAANWAGWVPIAEIGDFISGLDAERGQSLTFRFENERLLLDRATEKVIAGWGGWGRMFEVDPLTGRETTIVDGQWILTIAMSGLIGYIATFGLLCGAIIRQMFGAARQQADMWTTGLVVILTANLIDLIPNATLTPLTWVAAGALTGLAVRAGKTVSDDLAGKAPAPIAARPGMKAILG
ncbi:MAG: hypothetical protein P3W94_006240 [Paracoccus sp. (in: a-proteobacteria)]|nr:hypothetical protein [Paracoccus sp. (in: a-proteobacteria)]